MTTQIRLTVIFALLLAATALVSAESFEERLLREIELFQGTPYVWGGEDAGGADCSGALHYLFKRAGQPFPRMTARQMRFILCRGALHPYGQARRFDFVWWTFSAARPFGHVGLMDGDGRHFWQAGRSTGFVRRAFAAGNHWDRNFAGCARWPALDAAARPDHNEEEDHD